MRSAVRPNAIAKAISAGVPARGFHMNLAVPAQIELLGSLTFDFVFLDGEHGSFEVAEIENCCRAAELYDLTVVARVPSGDPNLISRYLNAGVQGIVVPHVDTVADAQAAVAACRYAPLGLRPSGGSRASRFWRGIDDLGGALAESNASVTLSVQIESVAALKALPAMLALGGIDYFTIGKQDLAQSMGYSRIENGVPEAVTSAVERAVDLIHARGSRVKDDVMTLCRVNRLLVDGAASFLAAAARSAS
jgi:2-keto-3-deoxy-L-rhamnonate aldolase RhmA